MKLLVEDASRGGHRVERTKEYRAMTGGQGPARVPGPRFVCPDFMRDLEKRFCGDLGRCPAMAQVDLVLDL
jgi:hypothetical protein